MLCCAFNAVAGGLIHDNADRVTQHTWIAGSPLLCCSWEWGMHHQPLTPGNLVKNLRSGNLTTKEPSHSKPVVAIPLANG